MWSYQKKLQYPVNIKNTNPKLAQYIVSQYGGPNGELGASLRYLSQRFSMPNDMTKALLTDIGNCYPKFYFRPQKKYVHSKSLSNTPLYWIYCVLKSYLKSLLQWSR